MNRIHILSLAAALALVAGPALARPVTYVGGTSLAVQRDPSMDSAELDLTVAPGWAVGAYADYRREDHLSTDGAVATRVVRWNLPASQANLTLQAGAGAAFVSDAARPAAWGVVGADWEDRRFYTAYSVRGLEVSRGPDRLTQTARVGVAPYLAESGEVQTLLIMQVDNDPTGRHPLSYSPIVRLTKGDLMGELGVRNTGGVFANVTKAF